MAGAIIRVPNRLAARTRARGGLAAGEAITLAETAIESLRAVSLDSIDVQMAEIDRLYGAGGVHRVSGSLSDLYDRALDIIDVSSGLPKSGLEAAARAICDFVSRSQSHHSCDWEAVDVHLAALKVLRAGGQTMTAAQRKDILAGLARVADARADAGPATPDIRD